MACFICSVSCVFLFFSFLPSATPTCSPVEEGSSTTLEVTVDVDDYFRNFDFNRMFVWTTPNNDLNIASCYKTFCESGFPVFEASIEGTVPTFNLNLTISNVSSTDREKFETTWECRVSDLDGKVFPVTACDMLEIYALPQAPMCSMTKVYDRDGELYSIYVNCSTNKVYPEADCIFYHYNDSVLQGDPVNISGSLFQEEYFDDQVYYRYGCEHTYPISELGEGTHSFEGRMHPRVTGGDGLPGVVNTEIDGDVALRFPNTSYDCNTEQKDDFLKGRSARCTCFVTDQSYPIATAQWYASELIEIPQDENGSITLDYDNDNPEELICGGTSNLGTSQGPSLSVKFAYPNSVEMLASASVISICDNNNREVTVTCRVAKIKASPGVEITFSQDGITFSDPQLVEDVGNYYQIQYNFEPDQGGVYHVTCRVKNSIFTDLVEQLPTSDLVYNEPPSEAPEISILGQMFQGTGSVPHSATLPDGFDGNITCRVRGGFPEVYNTTLECDGGTLAVTGLNGQGTLSFQAEAMSREMDETICTCTAQHISGCYDLNTSVSLNVQYHPSVTLTSSKTELEEGLSTSLTCQSMGNPPPSLILTRDRTGEELANRSSSKTKSNGLDIPLDYVSCLDTDTYLCKARNNIGIGTSLIDVNVRCAQKINQTMNGTLKVDAFIGETTALTVEMYGYPEPTSLTLSRWLNGRYQSVPPHQTVIYTASRKPYGSVQVTLKDLSVDDFTYYKITVDNGVGQSEALFTLNEVEAATSPSESSSERSDNITLILSVGGASFVLVILLVGAVVYLLRRNRLIKNQDNQSGTYLTPLDVQEPDDMTVETLPNDQNSSSNDYQTIPDCHYDDNFDSRNESRQQIGPQAGLYLFTIDAPFDGIDIYPSSGCQQTLSDDYQAGSDPSYETNQIH